MEERMMDDEFGKKIVVKKRKDGTIVDALDGNDPDAEALENTVAEDEFDEELTLEMPFSEDMEEIADMTPEEAAAFLKQKEEEEAQLKAAIEQCKADAKALLAEGDEEGAEEKFYEAMELAPYDLEANVEYAILRTDRFDENLDFDELVAIYNGGYDNCGDAFADEIAKRCSTPIAARLKTLVTEAEGVKARLDEATEKRRKIFVPDRNKKRVFFYITLGVLVIFAVLTGVFASLISAVKGNEFLISTIATGAVTLIAFVVFLVASNLYSNAAHLVRENENFSSTQDGRVYLALKEKIDFLTNALR